MLSFNSLAAAVYISYMKVNSAGEMKSNSQRTAARQYQKSELPRLRWTPELHQHFVEAVESIGGKHKATPKRILQKMHVKGLRISHIKSHLQMHRNRKGHAILAPVDQLLEGSLNAHVNDLEICSICSPQRSERTTLRGSRYESGILKKEFHLLDNKGLSQISEETDYDLNQEPESSACLLSDVSNEEENNRIIKFPGPPFSFGTTPPLIPTMRSGNDQEMMRFSSSTAAYNHDVDSSSSIQSLRNDYINLDLTI